MSAFTSTDTLSWPPSVADALASREGGVYDLALCTRVPLPVGVPARGLELGRSNSILRFGSDPYILLACARTRGMGLVGESNVGK